MKAKLLVEGKEFDIEILDPELQKLVTPAKKKTGYERVEQGQTYWCAYIDGLVDDLMEDMRSHDIDMYEAANYYSNQTVAENNARADTLMRKLRRFAVEHREKELNWANELQEKWFIVYDLYSHRNLEVGCSQIAIEVGVVYFDSEEAAKLAIETFRDELMWYFTEYKDSL